MNNNKQSNNNDIFTFLATFITVVVIGYLYLSSQYATYHKEKVQELFTSKADQRSQSINKDSVFDSTGLPKEVLKQKHVYKRRIEKIAQAKGITSKLEDRKIQQKQLLKKFNSLLSIQAKLPEDLYYKELDLDENIAGLMGTGTGPIKSLTILATRRKVNTSQIVEFLNESNNGVPAVRNLDFSKKALRVVDAPSHSGLSQVTLLKAKNSQTTYVAFIPRKDQQGSYLFILDATHDFLQNNEGYLDLLLGNLKAI